MSTWMIVGIVLAVLVLLLLVLRRRGGETVQITLYDYERRGRLMSATEHKMFDLLQEATGEQFQVYPKVGLAALIQPKTEAGETAEIPFEILRQQVDFVLCSADDMAVLAAIRLRVEPAVPEDSEEAEDLSAAMDPLEEALALAELSIAYLDPKKTYTPGDIQQHLADSLSLPMKVFGQATHRLSNEPKKEAAPKRGADGAPMCPACDAPMAQRTAKQGKHAGRTFWVCSKFPQCKKVVPVKN